MGEREKSKIKSVPELLKFSSPLSVDGLGY